MQSKARRLCGAQMYERARDEKSYYQDLLDDNDVKPYLISRHWLNKWKKHIERMRSNIQNFEDAEDYMR